MARISKKDVFGRLEFMNKVVGEEYHADFAAHYGGWELYRLNENCGRNYGVLGFDMRMSTTEFMAYIKGVIRAYQTIKFKY